jgi:hypothetical protein
MNFKKLKQLSNDIDLLEQSGKYSAAEVLHKKFIKEAQVVNNVQNYQARPGTVNQRTVYPGQGNAFERGDNFARSERGGVGTLYNFQGLQPEMEPVRVQTSPGNYTTVMRPKNNIGNPYATRPADPFRNIPGYNEFLSLRPSQSQIRDFIDARGTTTDAGTAIYNELSSQKGSKSLSLPSNTQPQVQAAEENTNTGQIASNPITINTVPIAKSFQPTMAPPPTAPARTQKPEISSTVPVNTPANTQAQPVAQDNFQNYYTEQSDIANFSQQQNANPNSQQESIEQKLYMNALNNIENALKYNDRNTAEAIYNKTINEFKNPKRRDLFGKQIQRVRSKYLNPAINQGPKQ